MIRRFWRNLAGWGINVAIALTALRVNLMRSILTTLGVMIGVFSVILAVAIGAGAQVSVTESIGALGANMAIVVPEPESDGPRRTTDRGRLTERDIKEIGKQVPGIIATAPQLRTRVQLVAAGRNATTEVLGVTPDYAIVSNVSTDEGRFIEQGDVNASSRVAVIGQTVATKLFGTYDPVGETVRINRVPFKIIGLLESKGSSFGNDNDDLVIVPLGTLRQRLLDTPAQGPDDIHVAFVGFDDEPSLVAGQRAVSYTHLTLPTSDLV